MAIQVALEHRTTYRYDRPVTLGPQTVRLRPAPHCRTPILAYSLKVEPAEHFVNWQQDPFGNHLARFVFPEPTRVLDVRVDLVADMTTINPFDFFLEEDAEQWPVPYPEQLGRDLAPYRRKQTGGPAFTAFLARAKAEAARGRRTIDVLVALNQLVQSEVGYSVRMEPGVQTPDETLQRAIGSCRDSGWLLVQVLRHLGVAARFASGYLVQLKADEEALDGPSGPEADFTDLHAWAEAFVPGAGWIGLDPTSGLFAGEGHIPLACTPEPSSAAPIDGVLSFAEVEFEHVNRVTRFHEDPRVTKPFTPSQWKAIDRLGKEVDRGLERGDVRLTMGGEPTFVSVDDRESPEWKTAADGGQKRERAWDLVNRLAARWAPGGVVQHSQGKWYPGEPLPRWQFNLWWRDDRVALWSDPKLLADPWDDGGATLADAEAVARSIAARLGVDPDDHLVPAYEDVLAELVREAQQPYGDPPEDAEEVLFAADRDADPVGYVLPLRHDHEGWVTTTWQFRRGRLHLIPGDSPVGLRLPLHSLSWTAPPVEPERSTMDPRDDLPKRLRSNRRVRPAKVADVADGSLSSVAVELRGGQVRVFLPPLTHVEDALELVQVVEEAAAEHDRPVVLEGYPLPHDPRIRLVSVAPDPGVIEVNIHPTASWEESRRVTRELYEEARRARLSTETFDLDGLHAGTGGGNHLTLGGPTPADSPLLRRPTLLRSMLAYWQHHPSLSYLFAGRFIGPTSQAPRVDEGRNDRLHHLDIAFAEVDRLDRGADDGDEGAVQPWQVDRLFRNLLTDLTGNTHRSEFCIDKLFSPDSERGRLGLLELRGFEMPPHWQMAMLQSLLVRAIVLRCWTAPYRRSPVRWGTLLHDRFLLPHWCERDLHDVLDDLADHDVALDPAWFGPFLEFRFPRIGTTTVDGVTLELRAGVEPWDVLGEEATGQGTARFVDSSMERLQVKVAGLVPDRHLVTVNGRAIPLHESGEPGVMVAGVRYRAWAPPSGLHPTLPVDAPLVFDVLDVHAGRSLGGATYHVVHPGGRNYDQFPVNAVEAESRRASRFEARGHTPGEVDVDRVLGTLPRISAEHPHTLDLRLPPRT